MNLTLVTIIAMCVGLCYGIPQSLEGSQAVFKINGSCSTPAGKPGRCISIYSCSQISNKLQNPPISEETIALVKSSICKSPVERSVCCETSIGEERVEGSCQAEMTAYPPDPSSACCGEDTVPVSKLTSVGGLPTPIDAHPWAVIIEYIRVQNKQTGLYCGGALISGKYVLTAAHCIAGSFMDIATPKVVRLGEYDLTQEGQDCVLSEFGGDPMDCTDGALRITIEKTIPHPEYTPKISKKNDIGLIRLQETAPYTDFIHPICLPTKDLTQPENMPVNFTMFAVGWGATKTRFQSTIKLQVEVPFVSQEKCQPAYNTAGRRATLGRGQLCAGGKKDVDTCRGDSGGPLVYENWNWSEHTGVVKRSQLIGIVSFGPNPCGEKDVPGIYTNVYEYLDWIRSVIVS